MTLYETLKGLALFPANAIFALTVGLLLSLIWRRAGFAILAATIAVFYLGSAPYTANRFTRWMQSVPPLTDLAPAKDAQAIVVLAAGASAGGPEYGGVLLDQLTTVRLRYAAHLYRQLELPILVSGGAISGTDTSLAGAMKEALEEDFGVPVKWAEDRSANTGANAKLSAEILTKDGVRKIVLVTHASHMPRSVELFRAEGFDVVPAPTGFAFATSDLPRDLMPRLSALQNFYLAAYEAMGAIWYRIRPAPSAESMVKPVQPEAGP